MKIPLRQLLPVFTASILVLVVIAMVSLNFGIPIPRMTKDVAAIGEIHPLSGFLSSLGILVWCAAMAICTFMARVLRNSNQREIVSFLYSSAILTLYLLVDDLFLFHERLASQFFGLSENVVYAVLGIAVSVYLFNYRQLILKTNYLILFLAIGFLGLSVVIDAILEPLLARLGYWEYFLEDGAKWLGIVAWCSYFVITSHQFLVSEFGQPNKDIQINAST